MQKKSEKQQKIVMVRYDKSAKKIISKKWSTRTVFIVLSTLILFIQTVRSATIDETIAVDENRSDNINLRNDNGE